MKFPITSYSGVNFGLLLIPPNWADAKPVKVTHKLDTWIGESRTTIEERRPGRSDLLFSLEYQLRIVDSVADDWRKGIAALGTLPVAIPLWVDALPVAYWNTRIYAPSKVINFDYDTDQYAIYDIGSVPSTPPYPYLAPLILTRWASRPPANIEGQDRGLVDISLTEDRPYGWQIGINAYGNEWVAEPNYANPAKDLSQYALELIKLQGVAAPQAGLDAVNAAARWLQEGQFTFASRLEIRQALTWFLQRKGAWQSWSPVPAWFQPGIETSYTPNNYTARFASDSIALSYQSGDAATAQIGFIQEINTPSRPQSLPAETYLFCFSYDLDPTNPDLYTNWSAPITAAEGTYQPYQVIYKQLDRSLKPQNEKAEIEMAYLTGSLAAAWMGARLFHSLRITIWKCDPLNPSTRGDPIFEGIVIGIVPNGNTLTITANLFGPALDRRFPAWVYGPNCNTYVFSPRCGLPEATYRSAGTCSSADLSSDGCTLTVHGPTGWGGPPFPDNWFGPNGILRTGSGRNSQIAMIIGNTTTSGNLIVKLNRPLWADMIDPTSQAVQLVPGCDGQPSTCQNKFNNYNNFRGFPFIPPFLQQVQPDQPKKPSK